MIFEKIRERLQEAREEAKELQKTTTDAYGYMKMKQGLDCAIGIVDEVEAEYNSGWISVDDRLPTMYEGHENDDIFIVSDGNKVYQRSFDYKEHRFCLSMYRGTFNTFYDDSVTYWQPLPQPPKGE